ncbi:MAG: ABC transporter ATP-binding protein/permease [Lachnospiraceae bacterium]|nr:ABC transporter ATP-binding protein/permease [Lachnospiraceae bacterium]
MDRSTSRTNGVKQAQKKSILAWILEWAGRKKGYYIGSILLAIINVLFKVIPFFIIGNIVQLLVEECKEPKEYITRIGTILVMFLVSELAHSFSTTASHVATFNVIGGIRKSVLDKLTRIPLGYVKDTPSGTLKSVIVERVDSIETTLAHVVPEFTSNLLAPLITFIYFIVIDYRLALWSLAPVGVGLIFFILMVSTTGTYYPRVIKAAKDLNGAAVEYIDGIEVIKAFSKTEGSYERFKEAARENANAPISWMRRCNLEQSGSLVIMPFTLLTVLPVGGFYVANGSLSVANFVMCVILSLCTVGPLMIIATYLDDISRVGLVLTEVTKILEQPELDRPADNGEKITGNGIDLENVRFSYDSSRIIITNDEQDVMSAKDKEKAAAAKKAAKEVLHGINIHIEPGTFNALVGPSGSGKSTIAKLIASFWDPDEGTIKLGGTDIRKIELEEYNRNIAYVSQDNYLFDMTVRDNIRLGKPSASDAEVEDIARKAGCYDFIMNLEKGFDTVCGGSGGHLSGGEKQRISIARAMLKDAPVIILDEATAYTDPENEAIIQSSIAKLVNGKTLLVIAHRLSTIKEADKIIVINDGNVEAEGKHAELLEKCPLYREMWEAHVAVKDSDEGVKADV